jgi:hypothetical protein
LHDEAVGAHASLPGIAKLRDEAKVIDFELVSGPA